jgi:hypothetical protein
MSPFPASVKITSARIKLAERTCGEGRYRALWRVKAAAELSFGQSLKWLAN